MYGVVSDDGRNATVNGSSGVFVLDWVTDEEAARISKIGFSKEYKDSTEF